MSVRVVIPQHVLDAIDARMRSLTSEGAPVDRLAAWHGRLFDLIESLGHMPARFPVAEAVTPALGYEVRRANHGDYVVFYRVDAVSQRVEILAFRYGRQRPWLEDDDL